DDYTCDSAVCVIDDTSVIYDCDDGLYCNGEETCSNAACQSGTQVDCSGFSLEPIQTCTNIPDENQYTWDYFIGFTSTCDEIEDECTLGTIDLTHTCDINECKAECETDNNCEDNECSEEYNDYCDENKLVEYDSDKVLDFTIVEDDCDNTCLEECSCTDCSVDCSAPSTNTYCVLGVCNSECEKNSDCSDTVCDQEDGCYGDVWRDYDNVSNNCYMDCTCEEEKCTVYDDEMNDENIDEIDDRCDCCEGLTGDINKDGIVDLGGDLELLIEYLFITYTEPECMLEANIDGSEDGVVDIGDLTALIDYLFITYTPPKPCPGYEGTASMTPPKYTQQNYERAMKIIEDAKSGGIRQDKTVATTKEITTEKEPVIIKKKETTPKEIQITVSDAKIKTTEVPKKTTTKSIVIGPIRVLR
ncbi:MAG: hypothetical protein KKC05_02585, partial [Nanoarchaeota archaeon]|nr:hypothetical protein [Nanoarchaeota archaeon]